MHEKFREVTSAIKNAAEKVVDTASSVVNHEDTKATLEWTKQVARTAADEAVELGKRAARSELAKDAATGAGIGAVVAVPIPLVGPALGAALGAGAGVYMSLKKGDKGGRRIGVDSADAELRKNFSEQLVELDSLLQRGILTQSEFDQKKRDILNRM